MVSLAKVRARCETVRKDTRRERMQYLCSLSSCVWGCVCVCGPAPTEMMDDGMCRPNLLTRLSLH